MQIREHRSDAVSENPLIIEFLADVTYVWSHVTKLDYQQARWRLKLGILTRSW
jgi:hypothetical protein